MTFEADAGHASERGPRPGNEDFVGVVFPQAHEREHGLVAALADGVSSGGRGLEAAQTAVVSLLVDYFGTPPTWDTTVALDRVIGAHNRWLHAAAQGRGMAALTALVLRGHSWTVAHAGDTRAYLVRQGEVRAITNDHCFDHPDRRHQLTRALGLDHSVHLDYFQGEVLPGDCFVLMSDGVHGALRPRALNDALLRAAAEDDTAEGAAQRLVVAALDAGGHDNTTALVLRVRGLDTGRLEDERVRARVLPVPPRLRVGETLDGFTVTALAADNGINLIYQVREAATQRLRALKTLHPARAGDPEERAMLAHEAWLAQRMAEHASPAARAFVAAHAAPQASAFYVLYDWHAGQTLAQRLKSQGPLAWSEVAALGITTGRALGLLHRQGVIHRDVKPANLHRGDDAQWRLLDLGAALSGRESAEQRALHAGTPSYMNPEQWEGAAADAGSDLFALGATLYEALTGAPPYGEVLPYQSGRYRRDPAAPSRARPEVPIWLDHVLQKAVARDAAQRFETAEEFVLALERGASRPLAAPPATPLMQRDPAALWKIAFVISLLFNALLIVWLLFLPR
jgi:serine/threonine protein phosphatase PrpC